MSIVLLTEPFSGGGSGSGTVTSIDVVGGTTGLTTSGGPVTTAGVITLGGTLAVANGGTGTSTPSLVAGTNVTITGIWPNQTINSSGGGGGGSGTVTSVSVVSSNGLAGTVANPTTTPAITLSTTVTGLLKGNGTSISAATSGADYAPATSGTSILYADGAGGFSSVTIGSGLTFSTGTLSATGGGGGSGTVTSVSVVSANGLAGTVANATTTPAITLSTSITGLLKGNGTAISAASAGTDYQAPITLTTTGTSGAATFVGNTLNIPQYSGGGTPGGSNTQIQFNSSGSFGGSANFTWDGTNVLIGSTGAIRLGSSGATYLAFKAPTTVASNVTWTLPSTDGTSGQVLQTSGTGTLSWVSQSGGGGGSPNLDGGIPSSNYGGITAIDGGTP